MFNGDEEASWRRKLNGVTHRNMGISRRRFIYPALRGIEILWSLALHILLQPPLEMIQIDTPVPLASNAFLKQPPLATRGNPDNCII